MKDVDIDRELRDMTTWIGPTPELWHRALATGVTPAFEPDPVRSRLRLVLSMSLGAAAVVAVFISSYLIMSPVAADPSEGTPVTLAFELDQSRPEQAAEEREVARKATIRIKASDVHDASVAVRALPDEAYGEFVEIAEVEATGRPRATIVLRIERGRVEEVLAQIRVLGSVVSEHVEAEDLTNQLVDVDARLANERRIEQELLELLDARDDAHVDEVMLVRRELNEVRERVELLDAQQQRLARLVRLASVTVNISSTVEETEVVTEGAWATFTQNLGNAMRGGLDALGASVAFVLALLIGGAPWFVLAGVAAVLAWRKLRQRRPLPV